MCSASFETTLKVVDISVFGKGDTKRGKLGMRESKRKDVAGTVRARVFLDRILEVGFNVRRILCSEVASQ